VTELIALYIVLGIIVLLVAVLAVNTLRKKPHPVAAGKTEPLKLDPDTFAEHLSGMIRFKTVTSVTMEGFDKKEFHGLHKYLEKTYPLLHKTLDKEIVNEYSLLFHWKGLVEGGKDLLGYPEIRIGERLRPEHVEGRYGKQGRSYPVVAHIEEVHGKIILVYPVVTERIAAQLR
jgi:hypothetical protein